MEATEVQRKTISDGTRIAGRNVKMMQVVFFQFSYTKQVRLLAS